MSVALILDLPAHQSGGFDGTELNVNKSIRVQTEQGLVVDIPNGDFEAGNQR